MSDVNLVTLRVSHHAAASGYDQLVDMMNVNIITTELELDMMQRVFASLTKGLITGSGSIWYHRNNFITELKVARQWLKTDGQIFHFLYGENSYRYSGLLKAINRKNRIITTYHTPPERFKEVVTHDASIRRLDAIIVVSTLQQAYFTEKMGLNRVHYIPHGINTQYFTPQAGSKPDDGQFRCICVGSHLRDYETLEKAARIIAKADKQVRFIVIAAVKYKTMFSSSENVEVHTGVSDDELLTLYQSANVLCLPLLDCTANNSLLEGLACGLPVVTTRLPAIHDYVDSTCSILVGKGESEALADALLDLKTDDVARTKMAQGSRERAMQFDWKTIAGQLERLYDECI